MSLKDIAPHAVARVVAFMRPREVETLLDVHDDDVRESLAEYAMRVFAQHLKTHMKSIKRSHWCWLPPTGVALKNGGLTAAVRYMVAHSTEPRQLMKNGGQSLEALLVAAAGSVTRVRIPVKGTLVVWCRWLLQLLRADCRTACCCTVVDLRDGEGQTSLQFMHGQYPECSALHGSGSRGTLSGPPSRINTIAYAAAFAGHLDCLLFLRASAAGYIDAPTADHSTALHAAAFNDHTDCVTFIALRYTRLNDRENRLGLTPTDAAVVSGSIACLNKVFMRFHSRGLVAAASKAASALHVPAASLTLLLRAPEVQPELRSIASAAATSNRVEVLRLMAACGVDFRAAAFFGIAEAAIPRGHTQEEHGTWPPCLQFFFTAGVRLGLNTVTGTSCAHVACELGSLEALEFVHSAGVDVSEPNVRGETPLLLAVQRGSLPCVRYLVDKAGVEVREHQASLLNTLASNQRKEHQDILAFLIARGANVKAEGGDAGTGRS